MTHTTSLKVRTYECDSYNHVNNAVYVNYLEVGRMDFLHAIGFDYKGIVAAGYYIYVTHIEVSYKASAFFGETLNIAVSPLKLKKITGEFKQIISKEDGTVCVEASVQWACVCAKTGRPAKIPDEFLVKGLYPEC